MAYRPSGCYKTNLLAPELLSVNLTSLTNVAFLSSQEMFSCVCHTIADNLIAVSLAVTNRQFFSTSHCLKMAVPISMPFVIAPTRL